MGSQYSPDLPRLDVSEVFGRGDVREGYMSEWSLDDGARFLIFATPADDHVAVRTALIAFPSGKSLERRDGDVAVTFQNLPRGGRRRYFVCPACDGRCLALFFDISDPDPLCRKCAGVSYVSQRETPLERKLARIAKLRLRLGSTTSFRELPPRPAGMHSVTYEGLVREITRLELEAMAMASNRRMGGPYLRRSIERPPPPIEDAVPRWTVAEVFAAAARAKVTAKARKDGADTA
ncbi:MAG TPA: hypothetical protein VKR23_01905 [Gaiellaceae bacterium]|nr:hypothetical protein [Gaiellaceae bacterium]